MTNELYIFGASNFGEEVAQLFHDISIQGPNWRIRGFLDDDRTKWGSTRDGLPVLGGRDWLQHSTSPACLVVAVGNPSARKRIVTALESIDNVRFVTGVHPSVITSASNAVGAGAIIMAGTIMTTNVLIGDHVIVNPGCTIGHNTRIERYCTINPRAAIAGDVLLEEGVYVGIGATVSNRLVLGKGAIIGAGAVVVRDMPAFATAIGVPARAIKLRPNDFDIGASACHI